MFNQKKEKFINAFNEKITYEEALIVVSDLINEIKKLKEKYSNEEILNKINDIRKAIRKSPLAKRIQDWPRGYPGDFETINYLLQGENNCKNNTFEYFIEDLYLNFDMVQQHKEKVIEQAKQIKEISKKENAKVLILACGSCPDLNLIKNDICNNCTITAINSDKDAIEFSKNRLKNSNLNIKFIEANALRFVNKVKDNKFDLVLAGGLFDYLSNRAIIHVLKQAKKVLNPNGKVFFTNISVLDSNNLGKICMENLGNWNLIERDKENLTFLCNAAGFNNVVVKIDPTGLTHWVEALV